MAPANDKAAPADLLAAAYDQLGFDQGALLPATSEPPPSALHDWVDKGDWQTLAAQVGAESVFFVDREPVVVFAKTADTTPVALRALYERVWCMSRPQLLFLACPGELLVLDLTKAPPKPDESIKGHSRLIAVARSIAEVQLKLANYHRERVETGVLFGEKRFSNSLNRSDRALIRDLKTVRQQLTAVSTHRGFKKPTLRDLHSLIGRAIFIRYLEDREILSTAYFENVASRRKEWTKLLAQAPTAPAIEPRLTENRFLRVLRNKDFAYALFDQMAVDFNGDTFPIDDEERERIQQDHLDQLRGFLLGNMTSQQELFFFAYRFDVIPIELISTIYEEFYNEREGKERNQGSHYTPPALVEFVLAQTLTPDILAQRPRVIDPACGSGIFLVESFRRIVRHLCAEQGGRRVSRPQLRKILREQIAGMDINEEAVRVAAFSLYLAFLHYQSPREINNERRLPYLKWCAEAERKKREKKTPDAQFFDLLDANSFEVIAGKYPAEVTKRFGSGCASIVVGNPPWGYPKKEDKEGRKAMAATTAWCQTKEGRPLGDKELSQAFIHLTLALLRSGGKAGLLVSSGIFFKHHANSRQFRRVWLESTKLKHVVNFAHVRHIFFSGVQREAQGISPFVSVVFEKTKVDLKSEDIRFPYWSAKRTAVVANTQAVILSRGDMHWLSQRDCLDNEKLWKIYWWGGHRDEALIRKLDAGQRLSELPAKLSGVSLIAGRGFEILSTGTPSDWLSGYKELPAKELVKYGAQSLRSLRDVPGKVYRRGQREIYSGRRLLVGRGIKGSGFITSRFETKKYCFKNSIHGVRFKGLEEWQEAVITAVFWSSLARYYYFTTIGSWGLWHDEIHLEHVQDMPISFPENGELRERLVKIVAQLQTLDLGPDNFPLASAQALNLLPSLERQLDDAVFDLYQLTPGERDLVREMCNTGLDLFYRKENSEALRVIAKPTQDAGTIANLKQADDGLSSYLHTFLKMWNAELDADSEFHWHVLSPPSGAPLIAVSFAARYKNNPVSKVSDGDAQAWHEILDTLDRISLNEVGRSRIFIDSFFRYITETEFLFIKRNEQRFWTRTAAREDAESALTFLMNQPAADVA